jgi:hypothetical protein
MNRKKIQLERRLDSARKSIKSRGSMYLVFISTRDSFYRQGNMKGWCRANIICNTYMSRLCEQEKKIKRLEEAYDRI